MDETVRILRQFDDEAAKLGGIVEHVEVWLSTTGRVCFKATFAPKPLAQTTGCLDYAGSL